MANKLSRKGLALGLATALGATGLVAAAPAAAAETMTLKLKSQTSNGVLATTYENDIDLIVDFEGTNTNLQYLKYDFTVATDGEDGADVYATYNSVDWNAVDDLATDVDTTDYRLELPNYTDVPARSKKFTTSAPASAQGVVDSTVQYRRTVVGEDGDTCEAIYTDLTAGTEPTGFRYFSKRTFVDTDDTAGVNYVYTNTWTLDTDYTSSNPEEWTAGNAPFGDCDDLGSGGTTASTAGSTDGQDYTVTYTAISGEFSGTVQEGRFPGFVSEINLDLFDGATPEFPTGATYVDVTVQAYLDTDGTTGMTGTETRSNPITVRFWNPDALTPVLTLKDGGKVWFNAANDTVPVVTETYISQELNDVYTEAKDGINDNWTVVNDRNYAASRDGYVHTGHASLTSGGYKDLLDAFVFDNDATPTYSGKHLFFVTPLNAEQEDINRVSVVDGNQTQTDTSFSATVSKIVSGPLMVSFHQRTVKDAVALPVESELVIAASASAAESDSLAHESATQVQYVISLLDAPVANWYEFATTTGAPAGVPSVDVTINGSYAGNSAMGALAINGTSILDETSNATKVAGDFEMEATSNASGQIVLTIAVASPKAGMVINLADIEVQGTTYDLDDVREGTADSPATITFQASVWELVNELNMEDTTDRRRHVEVGDSTSVKYDVRDQFMRAPADGTARVLFSYNGTTAGNNAVDGESRDFSGSIGDTVNVTNGGATVVVPDVNPAAEEGTVTVTARLEVKTSFGGWPTAPVSTETMIIDYVENAAVEEIFQVEKSSTAQISYFNFSDINTELSRTTAAQKATIDAVAAVAGTAHDITGYVRTAEGLPLRGHKVTISGAGLLFSDLVSPEFFGVGSLTLFTDSNGMYKFNVVGQIVGTSTLTITSGGKSVTATHITTGANVRAHNVAITSPFAAKAGTADTLTALVTDRYGNTMSANEPVTFTVVSGSGYIQEAAATTKTDAKGVATATLIIMSGEVGFNSTVRAAITQGAFAATSNSAAAQRSAGDTNLDKTTAWTKLQTDGTAKMYAKNIVGAGKVQFFHNNKEIAWVRAADALNPKLRAANGAFYLVRTVELVAGKNVLEVYIDGERVRRTAYSK